MTQFYMTQSGAFGYPVNFERVFETVGECMDATTDALGLTPAQRAALAETGYTDLLGDRFDGREFVRLAVVDADTYMAECAEIAWNAAMAEINALALAIATLDDIIAAQSAQSEPVEELVCCHRVDDVKVEVYADGRGKFALYVTDTVTLACDHRGTFNSQGAAMYELQTITGAF